MTKYGYDIVRNGYSVVGDCGEWEFDTKENAIKDAKDYMLSIAKTENIPLKELSYLIWNFEPVEKENKNEQHPYYYY